MVKELRKEKHVSYSSHDSCKSLSEELSDYYSGRHRSHPRPYFYRREKERKHQEAKINLSYFHGKDNGPKRRKTYSNIYKEKWVHT